MHLSPGQEHDAGALCRRDLNGRRSGSGYSLVGALEAQVALPDIREQVAAALREQATNP